MFYRSAGSNLVDTLGTVAPVLLAVRGDSLPGLQRKYVEEAQNLSETAGRLRNQESHVQVVVQDTRKEVRDEVHELHQTQERLTGAEDALRDQPHRTEDHLATVEQASRDRILREEHQADEVYSAAVSPFEDA